MTFLVPIRGEKKERGSSGMEFKECRLNMEITSVLGLGLEGGRVGFRH